MRRLAPGREDKAHASRVFGRLSRRTAEFWSEVTMLDLFYIAIGIVFFVLLWGFTKAAERL